MTDTIATVMQEDFLSFVPEVPIRAAVAALVEAGTAGAPVVDRTGALVGILTQKDCFRPALRASYYHSWSGSVADHMTAEIRSLPADTDIVSAAEAFLAEPYRMFPVLSGDHLVGILDRSDVLRYLIRHG